MPSLPPGSFAEEAGQLTTRELARKYSQTEDVIRRWRSLLSIAAPPPVVRTFSPTVVDVGVGPVLLTSDWHIPYHRDSMIVEVERAIAKWGIFHVFIVGDFIDFPTLSRFDPREIDSTVGMELSAAGDVLWRLLETGASIHWSRGNHELRFFRAMKHQVDIHDLIRMCGVEAPVALHGYDVEDIGIEVADERWLLTHPAAYSKLPLATPRRLAEKYEVNVATAHGHHMAMGDSPAGNMLLELGGLFDSRLLAYLNRGGATAFPRQQAGFWMLDTDGQPWPDWAL